MLHQSLTPFFSYSISNDCTFVDEESTTSVGEKDEALSKEVFKDFMLSFGETTWGPDITDISIFTDGDTFWAEVTVAVEENAEKIQDITFANLKTNGTPVSKVIVKDLDGNQLGLKVR